MDTDTELMALLLKLRKLQEKLNELETQQDKIKEELALTQATADAVRRKAERRRNGAGPSADPN